MPLGEGPKASAKNAERCQADLTVGMTSMQGLAEEKSLWLVLPESKDRVTVAAVKSCTVVLNKLLILQHILSSQHREMVQASRASVSSKSLLERFLQDVLQHHPHQYSDTRPSHADLPLLTTPLVPKEVLSEVYCGSDDEGASIGTREEMPTSDEESCQMLQIAASTPAVPTTTKPPSNIQCSSQKGNMGPGPPTPEKCSPTQGFLHRTSEIFEKPHTSHGTLPIVGETSQMHPFVPLRASKGIVVTEVEFVKHKKAQKKTNRDNEGSDSLKASCVQPAVKCISSKNQVAICSSREEESTKCISSLPPWKDLHKEQTFSHLSDQIREVINEVIEKYCYGVSHDPDQHKDDESFLPSPQSMSESKTSEEWDHAICVSLGKTKGESNNLAELLEIHINLKDQEYQAHLETALNTLNAFEEPMEAGEENVFPDLPHVPQSFIGKTLTQVMFEDDLKIDSIVREFQQGQFRCYFDSESLAMFGKHSKRRNKNRCKKAKDNKAGVDELNSNDVLPLVGHNEEYDEDLQNPPVSFKKSRRKMYRQVSRCQVVKVSHGTQTVSLSCPVVRPKPLEETFVSTPIEQTQQCATLEMTPDMKTRLCAQKLPASYCKIMSPLQPKTVVYVLSSPDGGQGITKPTPVKKAGRKRKSCESDGGVKYKYKKTPLKFYDPMTNRILKTPPKGLTSPSKPKSLSHVRQLFRSLSPDINKERQGQSSAGSNKHRCRSNLLELCTSTSDSILDSGGPSEPGSSAKSSRRALFTRSSVSSNSFLLGHLPPSTYRDDSSKALSHSCSGGSFKRVGQEREEPPKPTPIRRSLRKAGILSPAKRPPLPPYRNKRKSINLQQSTSQAKLQRPVSRECRTSPRIKSSARASVRSSAPSDLAIQPVISTSSKQISTVLSASQQRRGRGRTVTVNKAD